MLQKSHMGVLLERKLYLQKLRAIEKMGHERQWKDEERPSLWLQIQEILYKESPDFELRSCLI